MRRLDLLLVFTFLLCKNTVKSSCDTECKEHGQINGDVCVTCNAGWSGNCCQHCTGRLLVEGESGYISFGEFARFVRCGWLIKQRPEYADRTLKITLHDTLCQGVYLNIYDGDGEFSPLLASYNGVIRPGNEGDRAVIATSGSAFLAFTSNGAMVTSVGYNISYEYTTDSYEVTSGEPASVTTLPDIWTRYHWQNLTAQSRGSSTVTVLDDFAYIFSGDTLGDDLKREQMLRVNISDYTVETIQNDGTSTPQSRFGHSTVAWQDSLFVYGGMILNDYSITNEYWAFNTTSQMWSEVMLTGQNPPPLFGHTAHSVRMDNGQEKMIIIFGYHPDWRFSNYLFQVNFNDSGITALNRISTAGAIPRGAFGHASALDASTNQIYVLGGWKYSNSGGNDFYLYNVEESSWSILHPLLSSARYLHSMVYINGSIIVYGGRELQKSGNCPALPFEKFDTASSSWNQMSNEVTYNYSRFGHSAIADDSRSTMSLYGGFNGIMHSDVLHYNVDTVRRPCDSLNDTECMNSLYCLYSNNNCTDLGCSLGDGECSNLCERQDSCVDCLSVSIPCCQCMYSVECSHRCSNAEDQKCNSTAPDVGNCLANQTFDNMCRSQKSCFACGEIEECTWDGSSCRFGLGGSNCANSILEYASCSNCTSRGYSWCETTNTCFRSSDSNIYYPYGTCTDIRDNNNPCTDPCSVYTNCEECHKDRLMCGWCSENDDTGLGSCMSGTFDAPLISNSCQGNWSYALCPECQCNGHSTCVNETICYDCQSETEGDTCDVCSDGYYGNPVNGANCSECQCYGHALTCGSTGICDCNVYGVTGQHCEGCRKGFSGTPQDGTCYYELDAGYKYQFALPSAFTEMNFAICSPNSADLLVTIDSQDNLAETAEYYNATFTFNGTDSGNETQFGEYVNVTYVRLVLRDSLIHFGGANKTCVHIYMAFKPSFTFYIILQNDFPNIGIMLSVFFTVFLTLLLGVAIFWKLHSIWLRYHRRQQREVELRVMASRPYACIDFDYSVAGTHEEKATHFTGQSLDKSGATVGSVLLWVPFGSDCSEQEPMIAIGSALMKAKVVKDKPKKKKHSRRSWGARVSSGFDNPVLEADTPEPS